MRTCANLQNGSQRVRLPIPTLWISIVAHTKMPRSFNPTWLSSTTTPTIFTKRFGIALRISTLTRRARAMNRSLTQPCLVSRSTLPFMSFTKQAKLNIWTRRWQCLINPILIDSQKLVAQYGEAQVGCYHAGLDMTARSKMVNGFEEKETRRGPYYPFSSPPPSQRTPPQAAPVAAATATTATTAATTRMAPIDSSNGRSVSSRKLSTAVSQRNYQGDVWRADADQSANVNHTRTPRRTQHERANDEAIAPPDARFLMPSTEEPLILQRHQTKPRFKVAAYAEGLTASDAWKNLETINPSLD